MNISDELDRVGYIKLESFYSEKDVQKLRDICLNPSNSKTGSVINGDIITIKPIRDIIFNEKLMSYLVERFGEDLVYICDGSARGDDKALLKAARKYHSDSRADDFDFSKEYPLYRFGVYLQDTHDSSGGLKIRRKSHKKLCIDHGTWFSALYRFVKYAKKYKRIPPVSLSNGENLKTRKGDLLIWNMRLHHSGHAVRLKWFPNLSLLPFIENWIPESWKLPSKEKRCVVFFAFAKKSEYLDDFYLYNSVHPDNREHWKYSDFSKNDLRNFLDKTNISLSVDFHTDNLSQKQKLFKNKVFF